MKSDINITPLIDVLLVLLIIFMIVAPVAPTVLNASVPGRPPDDRERDGESSSNTLTLEVRTDDFALNRAAILTTGALAERLRAAFETRGDATLFVRVGEGVGYERVITALDVAREAGAGRIGLVDGAR